jgi:hypothetical protein
MAAEKLFKANERARMSPTAGSFLFMVLIPYRLTGKPDPRESKKGAGRWFA